jgi:hypothetical protein
MPEEQQVHAAGAQPGAQRLRHGAPAEPVDQHVHRDAPRSCAHQCVGDQPARGIVGEDVGLQVDLVQGRVEGRRERREVRTAAFQQFDRMAVDEACHGGCRTHRRRRLSRG